MSFRYAALALLVVAAPAMAQSLTATAVQVLPAEYGDDAVAVFGDNSLMVPVDSVFYDDATNTFQFLYGGQFPGGAATPGDPGEFRVGRFVWIATFTNTRTTPFTATGVRITYRTSAVSAATSSPPRVQYDGEPPVMAAFAGMTAPLPEDDSLSAPGAIVQKELPLITRTVPSTIDMYPLPQFGNPLTSLVAPGATRVDSRLVVQPGESVTFRFQHFNVPGPIALKASPDAARTTGVFRSFRNVAPAGQPPMGGYATPVNSDIGYVGVGQPDIGTPDGVEDILGIFRLVSDDAFFPNAGEEGADNVAVALGQPYPNPARDMVDLMFSLRDAGHARMSVYDVTGRQVATIADQTFGSGGQTTQFDTSGLASGVYVIVLEANGERATQRLSVVR